MKQFVFILLIVLFVMGCGKQDEEEIFKGATKQLFDTGFVAEVDHSAEERTICLGKKQSDGSIVAAPVATINTIDNVVAFLGSKEFLLIESPPEQIADNCIYVERGYADSKKAAITAGTQLSRVEADPNETP